MSKLKLERLDNGQYKIGLDAPFITEFFMLNDTIQTNGPVSKAQSSLNESTQTNDAMRSPANLINKAADMNLDQSKVLCFKYGKGVMIFNEQFASQYALKEARGRVQKMMLLEQNGLSEEAMESIRMQFQYCFLLTPMV